MILDLLEYSRVGRIRAPVEAVPLGDAVAEATAPLALAISETGARVRIEGSLPTVAMPRGEIVRLLQNLIGNAIKYHAPDRPPEVAISAAELADGRWQVSVHDNGIGIAPEYHDRIFQIFQRLHARGVYEGNGIGLAICKKIVESCGGRIWLDSEPGSGSTFMFTLPAAPPPTEAPRGGPDMPPEMAS